ncbi:hypothetical protein DFH06DRAFT_1145109 [Mycena polygramma]|nr:hypothetical protein DFH06DRAFT_1145109 [Mycena polygramma]
MVKDKELPTTSRTISENVSWIVGDVACPALCGVYFRVQVADNVEENIDVRLHAAKDPLTGAIADEIPVVEGKLDTVAVGAHLMCVVEPLRVDCPSGEDAYQRAVQISLAFNLYDAFAFHQAFVPAPLLVLSISSPLRLFTSFHVSTHLLLSSSMSGEPVSNNSDTDLWPDQGLFSVPTELLELIVLDAVGDYFEDPLSYVIQRTRILFTCRRIYLLVKKCARLWSSYALYPNKSFLELQQMSHNWSTSPLHLQLVFLGNGDASPPPHAGCASLDETLEFFVEHAPRCTDLRVDIDSFLELPAVFHALDRATYHGLKSLTFIWTECHLAFSPSIFRVLDVPFNGDELRNMATLRLFNIPFNWFQLSHFTGLNILVLHFQYADFTPGASQLGAVLRANPFLTKLSMRLHLARFPSPSGYIDPIVLPHLLTLDVDWYEGHGVVHEFVSMMRLPRLQELSYFFNRVADMEVFHALANNCHSVTTAFFSGRIPNFAAGARLLRAFPHLIDLDVSSMSALVFSSVFTEDSRAQTEHLCPVLSTLTVSDFRAQDMRTIVEARIDRGNALQTFHTFTPTFMSVPPQLSETWPIIGPQNWATLSTGLISRDHKKLLELKAKQHANAKLTEPLAACYLSDTFFAAVKALAESPDFRSSFVRTTNGYDQADRLFFVTPGGKITENWNEALDDYYDAFVDDAIIVVANSQAEAEQRQFEHPCLVDELILSSDP